MFMLSCTIEKTSITLSLSLFNINLAILRGKNSLSFQVPIYTNIPFKIAYTVASNIATTLVLSVKTHPLKITIGR